MINITPILAGFPAQTATTLSIFLNTFEVSSATTEGMATIYIYGNPSGSTFIDSTNVIIPSAIFTAFTNNVGSSGITTVENYIINDFGFTRL